MKKLALVMSLIMLASLMAIPTYAAPAPSEGPSISRDETIRPELPDPNDPDSPDYVVIEENGVPMGYIKIEDPDNPGQYVYALEEDVDNSDTPLDERPDIPTEEDIENGDVPLVESPKTGASGVNALLAVAVMLCLAGAAMVCTGKKKVTA